MNSKLAEVQTLQWAIQALAADQTPRDPNPKIGSFHYYDDDGYPRLVSTPLVIEILYSFMRGEGTWIQNNAFVGALRDSHGRMPTDDVARAEFRSKLSVQIHSLTGRKPRLTRQMNGMVEQWTIHSV